MSGRPLRSAFQHFGLPIHLVGTDSLSQLHEAEQAASEARRLAEIEAVVKQRIAKAVADAILTTSARAVQLVHLVCALPELDASGDSAIAEASEALLARDESTASYVGLFLTGQGQCQCAPFFPLAQIAVVNWLL